MKALAVRDVRNLREQTVELGPGLNLFLGENAQGKTSLLEAVGLLARGRSFRTEDLQEVTTRGAQGFEIRGYAADGDRETALGFHWTNDGRTYTVDHRAATAREYHGRLEASVYSTERLRVIHGTMRERRQYFDRAAAALSAAYRQTLREYERILRQRNAVLEGRTRGAGAWDERLVEVGGRLRARRHQYVARVNLALRTSFRPENESYEVIAEPRADGLSSDHDHQEHLRRELWAQSAIEHAARRTLVGPQRDAIHLRINGAEAKSEASSGQVRSLLLALTEATLRIYREQTGQTAVALLDDLDSELDGGRALTFCRTMAAQGQALVTSAHPEWADRLEEEAHIFRVSAGTATAC